MEYERPMLESTLQSSWKLDTEPNWNKTDIVLWALNNKYSHNVFPALSILSLEDVFSRNTKYVKLPFAT